jgi:hypothetical protein
MTGRAQKRCGKCGRVKPVGEFYAAKGGLSGRRPDCKSCSNAYHNEWARRRYVPKTGRRYRTRRDRAEAAGAGQGGGELAGA